MSHNVVADTGGILGDIPDYLMSRASGCPFDPPPALQALQEECPITRVRLWNGSTPWLVTRYDDQRALLADPRISADVTHPHYPHQTPARKASREQTQTFSTMDDPEHARQRLMVTARLSIKRVEALRPAIQKIVDGLIAKMLAGPRPVDLVEALALPVPSLVICELLGVPYSEHDYFQHNAKLLLNYKSTPEQGLTATQDLIAFMERLVREKLSDPSDDLVSDLAGQVRAGQLSLHEAAVTAQLILVAGHETTANMIALGTLALLQHPDELAALRDTSDPELIAGAVDELLRYLSVTHTGRRRVALADIEVGGQTIRAGEAVILPNDIGNRDASAFPDPDRLDIRRNARQHVAFGFGGHQCLGQNLARAELQTVYATLYRRIPTLRLATSLGQLAFKHDAIVYGVYELPVTW